MYLVAIAWLYVAMMMAVAEAIHPNGTWLGAIVTFLFYGLLPTGLVVYVMGTPLRRKARLAKESEEAAQARSTCLAMSNEPPTSEATTSSVVTDESQASNQTQAAMRPVLPSEPASRR